MGLPTRGTADALRSAVDDWQAGRASPAGYDETVERCRAAYARIVHTAPERVAVGSQVSVLVGLVAANLPEGAEVLTVDGEFTSVLFPLLVQADRGVRVRQVPADRLPDELRPGTDLVAFSLVQSSDGRVLPGDRIALAARAVGAVTLCDTTQAVGWLPVRSQEYDVTVCGTYKWLCTPRGVAFLTVGEATSQWLRPHCAGWYAGRSAWDSVYGPRMDLAPDARRFDVSPAWLPWVGAAPCLELFAATDAGALHRHDVDLAEEFRAGLGLPAAGRSVVALKDPHGTVRGALEAAGCRVAGRAGGVRLAFHVWNDRWDVQRALRAVRSVG